MSGGRESARAVAMPPLITFEQALELGGIEDHDEITRLVERAWEVRRERFGDSTDMMFEELGLNVARQPDNGASPRPDNRSGWLDGETPQTPVDELIDSQSEANFCDPSTQLRVVKKPQRPPPYPISADDAEREKEEAAAAVGEPGERPDPPGWGD